MKDFERIFLENSEKLDLSVNKQQIEQFYLYYKILIEWNEKMNLTAIVNLEDVIVKHFIDSLMVLKFLPKNIDSLIDVGTGAGFPGVPLKIAKNELKVTLLDSLNKRLFFLNALKEKLDLDFELVHARAEEFGRKEKYRENFDISTSRAVASLNVLSEYCLPFVKVGGLFIAMKSGNVDEELESAKKSIFLLGGKIEKVEKFTLPNNISRSTILIRKIKNTNKLYPRASAKIKKFPL